MNDEQLSKEEAFALLREIRTEHEASNDTISDDQDEP